MNGEAEINPNLLLASFYRRLERIEPIIRIVLYDSRISALLTFRGDPEKKVFLDYRKNPAKIEVDGAARDADVRVTIDGGVMHRVLLNRLKPGQALARREMLLRGSAADLAKFIRLLEFGPLLYDEHAADAGYPGYARKNFSMPLEENVMKEIIFNGAPIPTVRMSGGERFIAKSVNGLGFAVGYLLGLLRYRLVEKLSLFDVLTSMSRGLEAARPARPAPEE